VISNQIRVDTAVLAANVASPTGQTEAERRQQAQEAIRAAFAERPQEWILPGSSQCKQNGGAI
jgi:hypothetical protein